jgi:Cu/Ag efflux protein CusF
MKAFIKTLLVASVATAVLLSPSTVSAQDKAKEKAAEKAADKAGEKKAAGGGFNGKAVTVDKAAKTVKLSGEKGRTIQVSATTKIAKDGKPATLEDLKEGDDVYGGYKTGADGKLEATSLNIGKPPAKKKDEKKEEKK